MHTKKKKRLKDDLCPYITIRRHFKSLIWPRVDMMQLFQNMVKFCWCRFLEDKWKNLQYKFHFNFISQSVLQLSLVLHTWRKSIYNIKKFIDHFYERSEFSEVTSFICSQKSLFLIAFFFNDRYSNAYWGYVVFYPMGCWPINISCIKHHSYH